MTYPIFRPKRKDWLQYKEYAVHLDHQLKDASGKSAEYVAKHHAYAEALGAFGEAAAAMSKFESGPAANAFVELQKTTKAVSDLSMTQNVTMNRCEQPNSPKIGRLTLLVLPF